MEWKRIYKTTSELEAMNWQDILIGHGIECHLLNKKDSSYTIFGEIQIYVPDYQEQEARMILSYNGLMQDQEYLN